MVGIEPFASREVFSRAFLLYHIDLSSEVEVWFHTASLNFDAVLLRLFSFNLPVDLLSVLSSKFGLS